MNRLYGRPGCADWWDSEFEIDRAPFRSRCCAVWRVLFESFAPVGRALAPVYRLMIRARGSLIRGESAPNRTDVQSVAFETASSLWKLGVPQSELESGLRAYVGDIHGAATSIIAQRHELVGPFGTTGRDCRHGVSDGHLRVLRRAFGMV